MKLGESVQDYMTRVLDIVYQIRMLKEKVPVKIVVSKVFWSLTPRFMHVVHSIVEAKNLSTLTGDELSNSLESHESLINLAGEQEEKKALHIKGAPFGERGGRGDRGLGREYYRGQGRGRGWNVDQAHTTELNKPHKGVQCYACKKFGHIKSNWRYKNKEVNLTEDVKVRG